MRGSGLATPARRESITQLTWGSGPGPTWQTPMSAICCSAVPSLFDTIATATPAAASRANPAMLSSNVWVHRLCVERVKHAR